MKDFKEVQDYIVEFAKAKGACSAELRRAKNATDLPELLQVVKNNISWTVSNSLYDAVKMEDHFGKELMVDFGLWNSGEGNTGFSNTGDRNTGDRNTGDWNTGDWNTGYSNTGDWNTGDRNTGYSNTGDWNTGAFCTGETKIKLFNKESDWTHEQFRNSRVYQLLCEVDTKLWVYENAMTDEEKSKYPSYKTAEGYLKDIPFKEAFGNRWHNWSEQNRAAFTSLPNFDADIFETITGVKV